MLILSKEKEQGKNKAENPCSKYADKCLPDLPQASTFATLCRGGAGCRSSLLRDFHLSTSCCGNNMKSRSDGCQDQTGFSKNSTYVNDCWWPYSKRLSTQICTATDFTLPSRRVWSLFLVPRGSYELASPRFHQKLRDFPQRKCCQVNGSDTVPCSHVYAAFSLPRAGLSRALGSVKMWSNYHMIITHRSFSQALSDFCSVVAYNPLEFHPRAI